MFSACVVTHDVSKRQALSEYDIDLFDSYVATRELGLSFLPPPFDNLSSAGVKGGW